MSSIASRAALSAIRWYQTHISAHRPARCKYYPSCSNYMAIAIARFGFFRGGVLGVLRLLRCRPWSDGGIDDVPQKYSIFYRFAWSSAHEEPTTEPIIALADAAARKTAATPTHSHYQESQE